jgi:hypothetical protein
VTTTYDLHFYFDPVCPFAWMTSKWVRIVAEQRDYTVDWRFISLRILNADVDYATHFPSYYEEGHTAGLKLLRAAAKVRAEHGRDSVGPLYNAMGTRLFDTPRDKGLPAAEQAAAGARRGRAGRRRTARGPGRCAGRLIARRRDPRRDRRGARSDRA